MAGYSDTRQLIIDTLMGRPAGTEIQPEDHQAFALQITDYVRAVELVAGNATPIGFADASTVPVQPDNGQAVYLSQVNRGTTVTFANFIDQNGNAISITSDTNSVTFVTLLWNGQYWSSQTTVVSASVLTAETMRVTFTQSGSDITSSDSASAIQTAYNAGKYVYAVFGNKAMPLVNITSEQIAVFEATDYDEIVSYGVQGTAVSVVNATLLTADSQTLTQSQREQARKNIDAADIAGLELSLNDGNSIVLELGAINTSTGEEMASTKRVRSSFIRAPFYVSTTSGFKIRLLTKYTRGQDGTLVFAGEIAVANVTKTVTDETYIYRVVFNKDDDTQDISASEVAGIISTFKGRNYVALDETTDFIVPVNTSTHVGTLKIGVNSYPIFHSCIPLLSITGFPESSYVSGGFYFHSQIKKLKYIIGYYNSIDFPWIDGIIYSFEGRLYYWSGTDLQEFYEPDLSSIQTSISSIQTSISSIQTSISSRQPIVDNLPFLTFDHSSDAHTSLTFWGGNVGQTVSRAESSYVASLDSPIVVKNLSKLNLVSTIVGGANRVLFTSKDGVIISVVINTNTDKIITVPSNAYYAYINFTESETFECKCVGVYEKIATLDSEIATLDSEIATLDSYVAIGDAGAGTFALTADDFENGNLSGVTGEPISADNCIRQIESKRVLEGTIFTWSLNSGYRLGFAQYKEDGTFISIIQWGTDSGVTTLNSNCRFIKFVIAGPSGSSVYPVFSEVGLTVTSNKLLVKKRAMPYDQELDISSFFDIEMPIYAPSPQQAADGTVTGALAAETVTPSELYSKFDALISGISAPNSYFKNNPKYINKYDVEGDDASGQYKLKSYVLTRRNRFAWKHADRLFAWKDSSDNVVYIDSCSPRIGDTVYSDSSRTQASFTVSSYDAATQSFVGSNGTSYARYKAGNIAPDVFWTTTTTNSSNNSANPTSWNVYNKQGTLLGTATFVDYTHLSFNSKSYERYESFDYHTDNKATIIIWANEHGAQSDPYEGSITLYNLAHDLVTGGCRNNKFIQFLKNYAKVVLIPIANPYSMAMYASTHREGRNNYNNVNINRNYDCPGWSSQNDADKGSYAGDQPETQYMMNTTLNFDATMAIDIHCLGYASTPGNVGRCHWEGYIPNSDANSRVSYAMESYGLSYTSYGDADPENAAKGPDWIYFNDISGGLIEMNAGPCASSFDGNQHSALIMEADYTLLLNVIRMWWYGIDANLNLTKMFTK